jgi:hypothetical protein
MSYIMFYTKECQPYVRFFKTKRLANAFAAEFTFKHKNNVDDNWIECLVRGSIVKLYPGFEGITLVGKPK